MGYTSINLMNIKKVYRDKTSKKDEYLGLERNETTRLGLRGEIEEETQKAVFGVER